MRAGTPRHGSPSARGRVIHTLEDADAVAHAAAERVLDSGRAAIGARGAFRIALSGGATPGRLYRRLASAALRARCDWRRAVFLFADERAVPPDHPDSNYRLARQTLLEPLEIEPAQVRRMRGEEPDLDAAARAYELELESPIDLLVMGVGPDGHTASVFPEHAAAGEKLRRCVAVLDSPKPPPRRLTLTPRALEEALGAIVLATGAEKAAAVAAAFDASVTPERCPAVLLRDREWFVDREAAGRLPR